MIKKSSHCLEMTDREYADFLCTEDVFCHADPASRPSFVDNSGELCGPYALATRRCGNRAQRLDFARGEAGAEKWYRYTPLNDL